MIPRQKVEEILEAIWKADEAGEFTLGSVRRFCPEEISDENLQDLEHPETYGFAGHRDPKGVDDLADLDFLGVDEAAQ